MEDEQPLGSLRTDVVALVGQHPREPHRLTRSLLVVDVDIPASRVHQHEPRQAAPDDEPDDEQPPVELGVHRREV